MINIVYIKAYVIIYFLFINASENYKYIGNLLIIVIYKK